ncbi:MAG: tRNA pseudouridine(55) synthase TruB [SAR202 cluster bacterium]|nr:tRNA pseudouridine(55) synthase TruB [SAR202 cluster bacterium]
MSQKPTPNPVLDKAPARPSIDGILNIDKPRDITSMDVVRRIKRASRQKRVGHGGTLDPIATGVIPVCMGQATRMMEYLIEGRKEYRGVVEFGVETDTYDALGQVTARMDAVGLTQQTVEEALQSFVGVIQQVPPMYSALKRQGQRLYELARAGVEVEREPRRVEILSASLETWEPPLATVVVACGRGFYMRSLAYDLGKKAGCGAHLKSLVRLRSGSLRIEESVTLEAAEEAFVQDRWQPLLRAPDAVLSNLRAIVASPRLEQWVRQGQPIPPGVKIPHAQHGERARLYTSDGRFMAVVSFDSGAKQWQPDKVFDIKHIDTDLVTR